MSAPTRGQIDSGVRAAFINAAKIYAADPTNDTKKGAATDAYDLAYPAAGSLFAHEPSTAVTYELLEELDPDGTAETLLCVRAPAGPEYVIFTGRNAYDVVALWTTLGLEGAPTVANLLAGVLPE